MVDNLVITAHPDDETLFAGGFIIKNPNTLVLCVSHGLGEAHSFLGRVKLYITRHLEFKRAIRVFNENSISGKPIVKARILTSIDLLHYEKLIDKIGGVRTQGLLIRKLMPIIKRVILSVKPKRIITHNRFGEENHFLHKTVHKAVLRAVEDLEKKGLLGRVGKNFELLNFNSRIKILNIKTHRLITTRVVKGLEQERQELTIKLNDEELNLKLRALQQYKSQSFIFENNDKEVFKEEHFIYLSL